MGGQWLDRDVDAKRLDNSRLFRPQRNLELATRFKSFDDSIPVIAQTPLRNTQGSGNLGPAESFGHVP